jgi:hypothetical protein
MEVSGQLHVPVALPREKSTDVVSLIFVILYMVLSMDTLNGVELL